MHLTYEQICDITCGAVNVLQAEDGIRFYRFTQPQMDYYETVSENFFDKCFATAGVKLSFQTNSTKLFLQAVVERACTRSYVSFDVFVDGRPVGYLDNFSQTELPVDYSVEAFPLGRLSSEFSLGEGTKTVVVHLPWNVRVALEALCLDDGAFVTAVKPEKRLLAFGDSITQGFDALRPSRRYIARFAAALGAEELNKAIGGECFCPRLAALKDTFTPDYITVAYGTNDWSKTSPEVFRSNSSAFFRELQSNYPGTHIYVITPIWRANEQTLAQTRSPFSSVEEGIRDAVAGMNDVTVICGYDLVPHSTAYFGDYGLHPRDEGFDSYFDNLWKAIQ